MEWKHPSIIALKGYPFTGKSSLAFELALHLRFCQLLILDDIVDCITPAAYSSAPESDEQLIDKAFDILCSFVEKQLSIGQSVIIDSLPLSRPYLDFLVRLSKSLKATKLIIIECQIERQYAWKMRFEAGILGKDEAGGTIGWYKPRDWEADVMKIVKGYDKRLDDRIPGVSRLMLNVDELQRGRHVIQAIQALVFCQGDRQVDYRKWSDYNPSIIHQYEYKEQANRHEDRGHDKAYCQDNFLALHHAQDHGKKKPMTQRLLFPVSRSCNGTSHSITIFMPEGIQGYEADCGVCETPVIGPAYACKSCQMVLHRSCAEMELAEKRSFAPRDFPSFIKKSTSADNTDPYVYSFPKTFPCFHCREAGREYSDECSSCIYESHLKNRLIPTVMEHEGHEHMLSFWAMSIPRKGAYTCEACGKDGAYAAYACWVCEMNYHVKCALLPYSFRDHSHGRYQHTLELLFGCNDEDSYCYQCGYTMSQRDWCYYCVTCGLTFHLDCAFLEDVDL